MNIDCTGSQLRVRRVNAGCALQPIRCETQRADNAQRRGEGGAGGHTTTGTAALQPAGVALTLSCAYTLNPHPSRPPPNAPLSPSPLTPHRTVLLLPPLAPPSHSPAPPSLVRPTRVTRHTSHVTRHTVSKPG
eukprot:7385044-Prymnesium_polylepis.1